MIYDKLKFNVCGLLILITLCKKRNTYIIILMSYSTDVKNFKFDRVTGHCISLIG